MSQFTVPISFERSLRVDTSNKFTDAYIVIDHRQVAARVSASPGCEAELALCLSTMVETGMIDIEKLRAALVIAAPVAKETAARMREEKR